MDDILKNLKDSSGRVKLETNERVSARETLLMFMKENPLKQEKNLPIYQPILISNTKSPYVPEVWSIKYRSLIMNFAIVVIVFGLGTGAFAERAVPGNLLYGIKLGINENIKGAFSFTANQKINHNLNAIERRLEEGESLVASGTYEPTNGDSLNQSISKNIANLSSYIGDFEKNGDSGRALRVLAQTEVLLKGHVAYLESVSSSSDVSTLQTAVDSQKNNISESKLALEQRILATKDNNLEISTLETLKSTEKTLALNETDTTATISFNSTVQAPLAKMALMSVEPSVESSSLTKIQQARSLYDSANTLFQSKKYSEARILIEESNRLMNEIELSKSLSDRYKTNIVIPDDPNSDRFQKIIASSSESKATTTPKTTEKNKATTSPVERTVATSTATLATSTQTVASTTLDQR